jgi:hypothetical protein
MGSILELLANPKVLELLFGYWVFSAAVGALPTPTEKSPAVYVFVFRFGHSLSGNLSRAAVALKVPGSQEDGGEVRTS